MKHNEEHPNRESATGVAPMYRLISKLPGTHYTISQAALEVKRSSRTLRRWALVHSQLRPSVEYRIGEILIRLYTEKDLANLKRFAKLPHPGTVKRVPTAT